MSTNAESAARSAVSTRRRQPKRARSAAAVARAPLARDRESRSSSASASLRPARPPVAALAPSVPFDGAEDEGRRSERPPTGQRRGEQIGGLGGRGVVPVRRSGHGSLKQPAPGPNPGSLASSRPFSDFPVGPGRAAADPPTLATPARAIVISRSSDTFDRTRSSPGAADNCLQLCRDTCSRGIERNS